MFKRVLILALVLAAALAFGGCVKPYTIITPLEQSIAQPARVTVGDITDQLPIDMAEGKKPTIEDISKFRDVLEKHLEKSDVFLLGMSDTAAPAYEVRGSILEYKRGSGFMRFMFGAWAGGAKVVTHLELVDSRGHQIVFSGDFTGNVTSWAESGAAMYDRVAKEFAKQIKKQSEKLEPKEKS
jgi:hypothetical protein